MDKVGTYEFRAEPFHCDFTHKLFMGHLGNYMLNAAEYHSTDRGFGFDYLNSIKKTWVLSRLAVEMETMPTQFEKFTIETWVEGAMRYFTSRNFRIVSKSGEVYGYGRSVWAMIDTDTRQPQDILAVRDGEISNWIESEKMCSIEKSSRVKMTNDAEHVRTINTYYGDVDINGHVNSIKYIEHVLDLFDLEWYREHRIRRFEIAYVAETYQGDTMNFYKEEDAGQENTYNVRITKTPKDSSEEIEVCRCKLVLV